MNKSTQTREKILRKGFEYASSFGLLSVTIGEIAKAALMSRTGVISHFANKEDMQIAILKYTEQMFVESVLKRAYCQDPIDNLHNLKVIWLNWATSLNRQHKTSCPFIKAAIEYKDRDPGLIKAYMQDQQQRLLSYLSDLVERCKACGDFKQSTDSELFAYEFYSLYLGHSIQKNLLESKQAEQRFYLLIEQLISRHLSVAK